MIKSFLKKIESKRQSKKIIDRTLIKIKDISWNLIYIELALIYFWIKRKIQKGKLPDFLIIGAVKAGTTSLWQNMKSHPDIEMASKFVDKKTKQRKETRFFIDEHHWKKGKNWYASLFNKNQKIQGEATPEYIHSTVCHKRIFNIAPNAKLILLLRNPTERMYSQFNHMLEEKTGWYDDDLPTDDFTVFLKIIVNQGNQNSVLKKGFYIDQIENLLKYYPREQLLIIISEKMRKNPQKIYDEVFKFLGVKSIKIKYTQNVNKRNYKNNLKETDKKLLQEIYRPYNEKLFNFLGYKIEEWDN